MSAPTNHELGLPRRTRCKVCNHAGLSEIDAMLLSGAKYSLVISRMKASHPTETILTYPNLTHHKKAHLLTRPIKVKELDPVTGEPVEGYLIGHLKRAITVPMEVIPRGEERVPIPDALATVINAGLRNIAHDPSSVTPEMLLKAIELARKLGLVGTESDEFDKAWTALGVKRSEQKHKGRRTRKVTLEETVETTAENEQPVDTIDAEVIVPDEWSADDLKLLDSSNEEQE